MVPNALEVGVDLASFHSSGWSFSLAALRKLSGSSSRPPPRTTLGQSLVRDVSWVVGLCGLRVKIFENTDRVPISDTFPCTCRAVPHGLELLLADFLVLILTVVIVPSRIPRSQ